MTIDPTREEWQERRVLLCGKHSFSRQQADRILTTILGPCPPDPPPEPFVKGGYSLVQTWPGHQIYVPGFLLTPDEADGMAASLVEHARYARAHEAA